eukprot:TRINITY_DN16174_c0_g1_i1.p1 TRINITY_DN16174_c0_g1~~TRINITY_DN16174_c0_g1_i1.p1  ORF type:complete len:179 (-),score=39.63 TRINITY_DN16174_c0_g1_i1:174-710(-)
MFYWLRLLIQVILSLFVKKPLKDISEQITTTIAVFPDDIDFMFHCNNASYHSFTESARIEFMLRGRKLFKYTKFAFVAKSIRFRQSLHIFNVAQLKSRIIASKGRDMWFEHLLYYKNRVVCHAVARFTFMDKNMTLEKALKDPEMAKKIPSELPEEVKNLEDFEESSRKMLSNKEKQN